MIFLLIHVLRIVMYGMIKIYATQIYVIGA